MIIARRMKTLIAPRALPVLDFLLKIPFEFLMQSSSSFRTYVQKIENPKQNLQSYILHRLYFNWWEDRQYQPENYQEFQREYWDTIGQQRWFEASNNNYKDLEILLQRHLMKQDHSLLELGCGKGHGLAFVRMTFPLLSVDGIDASPKMCQSSRVLAPGAKIWCGYYGPGSPIPNDSTYDVILARSTLTYIDETCMDIRSFEASCCNI
jgi:SAM-dependent methyltransferase